MIKTKKIERSDESIPKKPLRLWPGVVIVFIQALLWYVISSIFPDALMTGVFAVLGGGLGVIVWWAFFSRAPIIERWGAILLMVVAMAATSLIIDDSIMSAQMGMTFFIYAIPVLSLAFVIWAIATSRLSNTIRRFTMVITILLACGVWTLFRTDGMNSDIGHDFSWRWTENPEELLLTQPLDELIAVPEDSLATEAVVDWPGFRGPLRDGIIRDVQIETNWSASPPVELWRRSIGPGWSSFAVQGNHIYTQEQRGEEELVSCYNMTTGKPVWRHRDKARFFGAAATPGPRATPTLVDGRLYTFGGTGILNVLNVKDGSLIWSRNSTDDADVKAPVWGFASSPLVVGDIVLVHVTDKLVAYDVATGEPRWFGPVGSGYSSPQLLTIDGIEQVLLASGTGLTSFSPADGTILWEYVSPEGDRILQPTLTANGDILLSDVIKNVNRFAIGKEQGGWEIDKGWTSSGMKPNFFDLVVHKGHAYGFDGPILACLETTDGNRKWKGKRYGGQILLLADQDLLLIISDKGELVLVEAKPDQFKEVARFPAIKGKTWNHPVLIDDLLLVRNSQEMAAFKITLTGGGD